MYLELDEGFPKHRKTLRLRSIMRDPKAGWYMVDLWTWACRSCPDGDLTGISAYEIEEAANYQKCDGKLCQAMIDTGVIDAEELGAPAKLHGWMDHTGGAIRKMADAAEDKRMYRLHRDGKCDGLSCKFCNKKPRPSEDSPKTDHGRNSDESDKDKSSPVQSSQDKSSPDQRDSLPRDPSAGTTEHHVDEPEPIKPSAFDWLTYYNARFFQKRGKQRGHASDSKALADLQDKLMAMPKAERDEDWSHRETIADEFLARSDRNTVEAGHMFAFFVTAFDGLRIPKENRPKPEPRTFQPEKPKAAIYPRFTPKQRPTSNP